ncbi:UDP-N-acetylglucosamine (UAA) transporter family [Klebsormidium nitens]|uniref:UDP-N-acetylglucosamine (UAA) transporter family n=1 Tax=Klebsormidium nitens TaxID=105231 RepID=A0A0U9HQX0_KLENI|nr:UDP-N-acetylglucosamine (UAA) transporter family [Klebsormidium nitens]|eukprot:GAQ81749.1 UDP-N-acetylglucosamine (UAA) transporter family [Klebsormidium nitens]
MPSLGEARQAADVIFLGINLSKRSKAAQLGICTGGFFVAYLIDGVAEEFVYARAGFSYGWYFTLVQSFVYILLMTLNGFRPKDCVNPWTTYVKIAGMLMASTGLSRGSLAYLNYPAQVMFKSTKVIPVMLLSNCLPGIKRTYLPQDYVAALSLVLGLIAFTLADAASSPRFHTLGVVMVLTALVLDAFMNNFTEAIFATAPRTSQTEMLYCTTIVGIPFLVVPMVATGEATKAWSAGLAHPYVYAALIADAFATYIGQLAILSMVALFGAGTTAMVTTLRKAVSILLSYAIFTKPLLGKHVLGLILMGFGILLKGLPQEIALPRKSRAPQKVHTALLKSEGGTAPLPGLHRTSRPAPASDAAYQVVPEDDSEADSQAALHVT